jgi:hypothetical protein
MREDWKSLGREQIPQLTGSRPFKGHETFHIIPKDFSGIKRASGDWNNLSRLSYFKVLESGRQFQERRNYIFMDNGLRTHPTKANIEKAFHDLAFSCQPGDTAFFIMPAGHSGTTPDLTGDESNGFDDSMHPVDYLENGEIIVDDIFTKSCCKTFCV